MMSERCSQAVPILQVAVSEQRSACSPPVIFALAAAADPAAPDQQLVAAGLCQGFGVKAFVSLSESLNDIADRLDNGLQGQFMQQ
jgi:hypothetical protein